MRRPIRAIILLSLAAAIAPAQDKKSPLKLLYVGEADQAARATAYVDFLKPHFAEVVAVNHSTIKKDLVAAADVVLFEWHQGSAEFPPKSCPLGERADWNKPTVLIGSAGLFLACIWKVNGGSG